MLRIYRNATIRASALALMGLAATGCAEDACSDLAPRLERAATGDVVRVGACTIAGDVVVPSGVTLEGDGASLSRLTTPGEVVGLRVEPGATVRGVRIEGPSLPVVELRGDARLSDVEVVAPLGVGVRVVGAGAELVRVRVLGPVTEDNATSVAVGAGTDTTATHGIVLAEADGGVVRLEDVEVEGFATAGVLSLGAALEWVGGAARRNLRVGLRVAGGSARLEDVALEGQLQGVQPGLTFGAVFSDADVTTDALSVLENEGLGVLHQGGVVTHRALTASANGDAAVWVQSTASLTIEDGVLEGNRLAGVVLVTTPSVTITRTQIAGTERALRVMDAGSIMVGDGLHALLREGDVLSLDDVTLSGNARAGALLDVSADLAGASLRAVRVDGPEDSFGVVAQREGARVELAPALDGAITRTGGPLVNDPSFGGLPVLGIVGPMFLPPVE